MDDLVEIIVDITFQATFECLFSLLEHCMDQIDMSAFLDYVQLTLEDHADVKTLGFMFIERLVKNHPEALAESEFVTVFSSRF